MDYPKVLNNSRGKGFVIACGKPNITGAGVNFPACPLEEGKKPHKTNARINPHVQRG